MIDIDLLCSHQILVAFWLCVKGKYFAVHSAIVISDMTRKQTNEAAGRDSQWQMGGPEHMNLANILGGYLAV